MGSIVLDLQQEIISQDCDIVNALRKAHLIAVKLGLEEFDNWILNELNGYSSQKDCPDYRKIHVVLRGFNPYHGWIPTMINDPEFEKIFTIIVHAIQKRLDNKNNIDEHIKKFLEEDEEVEGLSKETIEANKIKYQINVSKKIGVNEITEDENTTTQGETNGETTEPGAVSAGVTTTPKEGE